MANPALGSHAIPPRRPSRRKYGRIPLRKIEAKRSTSKRIDTKEAFGNARETSGRNRNGESLIRATLPAGHDLLASSIDLFIIFDAIGLVLMAASWGIFFLLEKRTCARIHA